jgi:two-component system, LuxR family, sensor histidine kinase TtrS
MRHLLPIWFSLLIMGITCLAVTPAYSNNAGDIRIGVLAFRGADHVERSWSPTADYLARQIPNVRFEIVPLPLAELETATAQGRVDYVFTNSGQYVVLEEKYGISRIATVKKPFGNSVRNVFGAVIFTRSDTPDIHTIDHLKGKKFAAVRRGAFGGFQMAWREFKAHGINPFEDFSELSFLGLPQDDIVFAVRDGLADAGTVRTDVLETMAEEGAIEIGNFRILNRKTVAGHNIALSTRLYPEWPFAKMPHASDELSEKIAIALLRMKADSPEMLAAGYFGWTVPLDYQPVHNLFRELEIGPYAKGEIDVLEALAQHWEWMIFLCVILMMIILHGIRTEHLVQRRTRQLSEVNRELEHEIIERKSAQDRARQHETELAHVSRVSVIGEMTSGLAHELRQPLAAIRNYSEGGIRRLEKRNGDHDEIKEALVHITEQAGRAGQIISRVRGYLKKRDPREEPVDLNHAVREAAQFFELDARRNDISVTLNLEPDLPTIRGDLIEIEQLIINLARNSLEAMAGTATNKTITIQTSREYDQIRVDVIDNGPGLDPAFENKIWLPFTTSKDGGLGLGLAICHSIVESHGGKIEVVRQETGGTIATFLLPVDEEDHVGGKS